MANLFDIKLVFTQIPTILKSLPQTLELTAVALVIGLLMGLIIAIIRTNKIPVLTQISKFFVSFMRGTPIIVQLYLLISGFPLHLNISIIITEPTTTSMEFPALLFAMIALGLNQSAFDSETIRSAIQSVDKGQIEAAKSMGMSGWQVLNRVIIPQAGAVAILPLGNSLIALIKGTSLAFTCSVIELTAQGKILAGINYRYFEVYCSLAIIYWIITIVLEQILKWLETKVTIPDDVPERDSDGKISKAKKKRESGKKLAEAS